jgi:hypothetical protein
MADTSGAPAVVIAPIPALPPRAELNLVQLAIGPNNPTRDFNGAQVSTWTAGVTWRPENVTKGGIADACNVGTLTPAANLSKQRAIPFFIWEAEDCTSAQDQDVADAQGRAVRLLKANLSQRIAKEMWRGDQAGPNGWPNPYLARDAAGGPYVDGSVPSVVKKVAAGSTVNPIAALAALDQAIATYGTGAQGMIHCTRRTLDVWASNHLVNREGGLLLSPQSNVIVADAGYDGSGPGAGGTAHAAAAPDATGVQAWAYATGMVQTFVSDIEVGGAQRANDALLGLPQGLGPDAQTITRGGSPDTTSYNRRVVIASCYGVAIFDPAIQIGCLIDHTLDLTDTTHWSATLP